MASRKTTQTKLGSRSGKKKTPTKRRKQTPKSGATLKKRAAPGRGRTIRRSTTQTGSSNTAADRRRTALPPGRRISGQGNRYTENRRNRSDKSKKKRL